MDFTKEKDQDQAIKLAEALLDSIRFMGLGYKDSLAVASITYLLALGDLICAAQNSPESHAALNKFLDPIVEEMVRVTRDKITLENIKNLQDEFAAMNSGQGKNVDLLNMPTSTLVN